MAYETDSFSGSATVSRRRRPTDYAMHVFFSILILTVEPLARASTTSDRAAEIIAESVTFCDIV
jgi:hypothetical protein